ncbi:MAG: ribosome maturation factor RimM [Gammaproteobacteria bacterium]|nr:16S rRNA processing protein RimM [Gammaproteobacteria bacterium]
MSDEPASVPEPTRSKPASDRVVTLGKIVGTFGVRGWVKVQSFTDPPDNIFRYDNWCVRRTADEWVRLAVEDSRMSGKRALAKLEGIATPEQARLYVGAEVGVPRSELPALGPGEYYWTDLEGLEARGASGEVLGRVDHFRRLPGGDIVVVRGEREHWIPLVKDRILQVDLEDGYIVFDWASDW